MPQLLPFVYRVCRLDPNCNRDAVSEWHQGDNPEHGSDRFIVYIGPFSYTYYHADWMCDEKVGTRPLCFDLDIIEEEHEFNNEKDVLRFLQEWWGKQNFGPMA